MRSESQTHPAPHADHLSDDFVMAAGNGRRLDKTEFLRRMAEEPGVLCGLAAD